MKNNSSLKLSKTSKIFGTKKATYEECTMPEKVLVRHCFKSRFPSRFCKEKCRFYEICCSF